MEMISLQNVSKSFRVYADRANTLKERTLFRRRRQHRVNEVLKDISLTVSRGDVVGLIGRNGCGKSTTLKLMTRILYPDAGQLTVSGRVSSLLELGAGFHPDLSGRDNIYANAAVFGLTKRQTDERLSRIIEFSELEEFIDNPVRTYSSGMYMRLAFSVAINVDAEILLIDEILAVGDANFQQKCYRRLAELKDRGITIVIVTHDTNVVETFCNRAVWLEGGRLMADGAPIEVVDEYRKYMNKRQIERMRADEEKLRQAGQERELDLSAEHFGTGDVEITDAYMTNAAGERTGVLSGGQAAAIHIHYKVHTPQQGYMFGMGFYTMDGVLIYGNNTNIDGLTLSDVPEGGEFVFEMDSLPLLSGQYKLNVAVVDHNQTPLDFYRSYLEFNVVSDDRSPGVAEVAHRWIVP